MPRSQLLLIDLPLAYRQIVDVNYRLYLDAETMLHVHTFIAINKEFDSQRLNAFGLMLLSISSNSPFSIVSSKRHSNTFPLLCCLPRIRNHVRYKELLLFDYRTVRHS